MLILLFFRFEDYQFMLFTGGREQQWKHRNENKP